MGEIERIKSTGYNAWTQNGNVIVFFHRLTPDYECVNFTLRRYLPVARLSPYVPVELRHWYSPERKNTTMVFLPAMNAVSVVKFVEVQTVPIAIWIRHLSNNLCFLMLQY